MSQLTAHDVANYFLYLDSRDQEADGISNLKMQKLAYYAYGFHYAIFGTQLFEDTITAWRHGPVCESLYQSFHGYGKNFIPFNNNTFDIATISIEQQELLNDIYEEYSQFSAWKLSKMTHEEMPWLRGRKRLGASANNEHGEMFDSDFLEHFSNVLKANETATLLEEYPEILDDLEAIQNGTFEGVPHESKVEMPS